MLREFKIVHEKMVILQCNKLKFNKETGNIYYFIIKPQLELKQICAFVRFYFS